jgi:NADH dehydrogenase
LGDERVPIDAVTGATSYTGRFIAVLLAERGRTVLNLTRRGLGPQEEATGSRASAEPRMPEIPFPSSSGADLARALDGVDTLYNTHWIRFERGDVTYHRAIDETRHLLEAARAAGVRRIVHVSVIHASHAAPTAYFRAKAEAEDVVRQLAPSHAIVRPTVTFGPGDILVNNLAWTLRRLPVFGIPGDGRYPIQPVHVTDIARIAVEAGEAAGNPSLDAAGPDRFAFGQFVRIVRSAVRSRSLVVPMPVPVALLAARAIGAVVRDVVLRRDEVTELQVGLMVSDQPPLGRIGFGEWVQEHSDELGRRWASELDRHYRPRRQLRPRMRED